MSSAFYKMVNTYAHIQAYTFRFLIEPIRVKNQISGQECILITSVMEYGQKVGQNQ